MVQATCIQKFRDKQGRIVAYRLRDTSNAIMDIKSYALKNAIANKQIYINNLKLTSDGRLLDSKNKPVEKTSNNKSKGISLKDIATAMVIIDRDTLGMGDSYAEIVDNVCIHAGMKAESYGLSPEELVSRHREAYEKLLEKNAGSTYTTYTAWYEEEEDTYRDSLRYYSPQKDKNKLLVSFKIMESFGAKLLSKGLISKDSYELVKRIKDDLDSVDLQLCCLGYQVANEFISYLDGRYFNRTNDHYTTGGIPEEDSQEQCYGVYVIHATYNSLLVADRTSYAIGFNRDSGNIRLDIAEHIESSKNHEDYYRVMGSIKPKTTDVKQLSKILADRLNKLAVDKVGVITDASGSMSSVFRIG